MCLNQVVECCDAQISLLWGKKLCSLHKKRSFTVLPSQVSTFSTDGTGGWMSLVTSLPRSCTSSASRPAGRESSRGTGRSVSVTCWTGDTLAGSVLMFEGVVGVKQESEQPFCSLLLTSCALHVSFLPQYYISARHMALAKAFPDTYIYEPHDPTSVSLQVHLCAYV